MFVDPEGAIIGKYRKTHPAAARSLEKIYFRYGSKFPVFEIAEFKVGTVICYDFMLPGVGAVCRPQRRGADRCALLQPGLLPFARCHQRSGGGRERRRRRGAEAAEVEVHEHHPRP